MKRYIISCILFIWTCIPLHSYANTWSSDSIEAEVGYGNYINPGRYTPITITIKNGYAASGGEVELNVPTNTNDRYLYRKPYPSSPGTVRVTFCVPLSTSEERISVSIYNSQNPPEHIVLNYSFPQPTEDSHIFLGTLSDSPDTLNYLNQLNLTNFDLECYSHALSKEELSSDFRMLDSFDCIIIDDFSLSSLYETQLESLREWVYHGGILLLGTQVESSDLLLPSSSLDVSYTTISELDYATLTKYSYGNGYFFTSSFSLTSIGSFFINNQLLQDTFIETLFGHDLLQNLEQPPFSILHSLENEAAALTSQVQATTNVNLLLYGFILVVYLFILLPVVYYQLKKRDLTQCFCFALPIISILVAGIIFLFGSNTRFSHPFLNYVSIQQYKDNTVQESIFTGIQAPYNRTYSVSIDNSYHLIPLQTSSSFTVPSNGTFGNHQIHIDYRESDYLLTFHNLVAFNMRNFQLEKTSTLSQDQLVSGYVTYYDNSVSGVLSNQLDTDLSHAILALPGYFVRIGDFPNDTSVTLEDCDSQMNASAGYQPPDPSILKPIVSNPSASVSYTDMKLNLLYYYLEKCNLSNQNMGYLIGFTNNTASFQFDTDYTMNGLTLVSVPISLTTNSMGKEYYTSLPAKAHKISGDFSEDEESIYSHFATVRYDIPQDCTIDQLELSFPNSGSSTSYVSKIYFWNKNKYEQVYPGKTYFKKEELENYITSENSLLIQYYTEDNYARLPRITAIGDVDNVNN
ncbi:hypothetical protein NDGK_02747 [Clostridiales bacterium CHKCI001]|nr:hypothetical protein NDGK_02747 [Clostridiales bacterium CHKCI001]